MLWVREKFLVIPDVHKSHEIFEIHDLLHHLQQRLQIQNLCGQFSWDPTSNKHAQINK